MSTEVWSDVPRVPHVQIGKTADLVVVAPATADLLARAAAGLADDLLTTTLLTARCPVVFAPAMHTEMWEHPATQANVATLTARGAHIVPPASGRLTGADTGPGRLPEPEEIFAVCQRLLALPTRGSTELVRRRVGNWALRRVGSGKPLAGRRVVVSAGGTREPLDPVRYLGNRSSGKQGYALAQVAAARGADRDAGRRQHLAPGADRRGRRPGGHRPGAAGRRAPRRPRTPTSSSWRRRWPTSGPRPTPAAKIKKTHAATVDGGPDESAPTIELVRNPDILAGLVEAPRRGRAGR